MITDDPQLQRLRIVRDLGIEAQTQRLAVMPALGLDVWLHGLAVGEFGTESLLAIEPDGRRILAFLLKGLPDDPECETGRVAPPGQHPCESPDTCLSWLSRRARELALD
jgi:hypothetical protein